MQLKNGCLLLIFCLLYTTLNQKLSRHFSQGDLRSFDLCERRDNIHASSLPTRFLRSIRFIVPAQLLDDRSERKVIDAKMHLHSIATLVAERWLTLLALFGAGLAIWRGGELWLGLALSLGLLGLLHGLRKRISMETFRVLADASLVLGALYALGFNGSSWLDSPHDELVASGV